MKTLFSFFWWIKTFFFTIVYSLRSIRASKVDPSGKASQQWNAAWGRNLIKSARIQVEFKGSYPASKDQPWIIISNHQSQFDIFLLSGLLPFFFQFLSKESIFQIPLVGPSMRAAGDISVRREEPRAAAMAFRKAAQRLKAGISVCIFPEGTRSLTGKIQDFHSGAFRLSQRTGRPIFPVLISGSRNICPKSSWRLSPEQKIVLTFFPLQKVKPESSVQEAARALMEKMKEKQNSC